MAKTSQPARLIQSLEKGMAVLELLSRDGAALTSSEVASQTGLTRATARRMLRTLEHLGYVRSNGRRFQLAARVLSLGATYLSSSTLPELAQPLLEELTQQTGETSSVATLDLPDIVCVARVAAPRPVSFAPRIGLRIPAHTSATGHLLLAELSPDELDAYLESTELKPLAAQTITDAGALQARLERVRSDGWAIASYDGWAIVGSEYEFGIRAIAAPVRDSKGTAVAGVNLIMFAPQATNEELADRYLGAVIDCARNLSAAVAMAVPASAFREASSGRAGA